MKKFSFSFSLFKNTLTLRGRPKGLVPFAETIWRGSILVLILLLIGALFFDGYVFVVRIRELEAQSVDVGSQGELESIKNSLASSTKQIFSKRISAREHAGDNLPAQNPFTGQ
jgi:hypothetical protein